MVLAKFCDRRSFPDHSQNIWSTITHDHDRQKLEKYDLRSLMIVIWSEMIGDHDPISPTLIWVNVPMSLNETIPSRKYSITARKVLLYVLMMKPLSHCNILLLTRKLFYITPICERSPRQTTCLLCCCKKYSRKLLLLMIWHPYVMPAWIIWVCNSVTCHLYWNWHAIVGMKF